MLTAKEAFARIPEKRRKGMTLRGCGDWNTFWTFDLAPASFKNEDYGGGSTVVDKATGEVSAASGPRLLDIYKKTGKKPVSVPVEQVTE